MQPSTRTGMTAGVTEKENKLVPRNIIVGRYRFSKKKGVTSHIFFTLPTNDFICDVAQIRFTDQQSIKPLPIGSL